MSSSSSARSSARGPVAPAYSPAGRRVAEAVQLWLLPTGGLAVAGLWWHALGLRGAPLAVALAYPAVVSTPVVVLGAGVLRLWRFPVPYAVAGFPPWIGLIYAGTINLAFAAAAAALGVEAFTGSAALAVALGAALGAAAGVAYDVSATHFELLEPPERMHGRRRPRRSAWAVVRRYGFQFFGGMGAVSGAALWLGYWTFAGGAAAAWQVAAWLAVAGLLGAAPFAAALLWQARRLRRRPAARAE